VFEMPLAFVLLNVQSGTDEEVAEKIRGTPSVKEVSRIYGIYDLILRVEVENLNEIKALVESKLRRMPEVKSTLTMIAAEKSLKS